MWTIAEALLKRSEFNVAGSIFGNEIGDSSATTYAGTLSVKKAGVLSKSSTIFTLCSFIQMHFGRRSWLHTIKHRVWKIPSFFLIETLKSYVSCSIYGNWHLGIIFDYVQRIVTFIKNRGFVKTFTIHISRSMYGGGIWESNFTIFEWLLSVKKNWGFLKNVQSLCFLCYFMLCTYFFC